MPRPTYFAQMMRRRQSRLLQRLRAYTGTRAFFGYCWACGSSSGCCSTFLRCGLGGSSGLGTGSEEVSSNSSRLANASSLCGQVRSVAEKRKLLFPIVGCDGKEKESRKWKFKKGDPRVSSSRRGSACHNLLGSV